MEKGLWTLETVNIRDFAFDAHRSVDDTLWGGAGMVLKADVLDRLYASLEEKIDHPFYYLSPGETVNPSSGDTIGRWTWCVTLVGDMKE